MTIHRAFFTCDTCGKRGDVPVTGGRPTGWREQIYGHRDVCDECAAYVAEAVAEAGKMAVARLKARPPKRQEANG